MKNYKVQNCGVRWEGLTELGRKPTNASPGPRYRTRSLKRGSRLDNDFMKIEMNDEPVAARRAGDQASPKFSPNPC